MCNGPLISARGRLNWSDKVRTGKLICCEITFANINLHDAPKQTLGLESAHNQTVDIPGSGHLKKLEIFG